MLVNALSYGTIIPLLYPYASRFGMTATGMGFLFASFSLAQFIATPIIGRLSDVYGRKPLLLLSLLGTSVSLSLFALARSIPMLFIARIFDGITGGNISVAQAIIADSTTTKDRAKAFGILGAAFGFGFTFGPAIGGFLSQWHITAPFWFSAALAFVGTILGYIVLQETNTHRETKRKAQASLSPKLLAQALTIPVVGIILITSFIVFIAQNAMIIGFNATTVDDLALNPSQIGLIFTLWGIIALLMRAVGIKYLLQWFKVKEKIIAGSMVLAIAAITAVSFTSTLPLFMITILIYGAASAPIETLLTSMVSENTNPEDQGGMLGINQAYTSLAQIIGPIAAGLIVTQSTQYVFWFCAALLSLGLAVHVRYRPSKVKANI